jgi:hypothetical protein
MRVNVPLMRKTMEHIHEHPEEWNQGQWVSACGTMACFAGRALILAGRDLKQVAHGMGFQWEAMVELGLTFDQSGQLFYGGNNLEDLERLVELIINGSPLPSVEGVPFATLVNA